MRRCLEIILLTAGGTIEASPVDLHPVVANPPRIFLRLARVKQVLGLELGLHEVERCLVAIGATVVAKPDDGRLAVDVPGWRPDLTTEIDLVEEVARMHGYDRVPTELRPFRVGSLPDAPAVSVKGRIRSGMVAEGLSEVVSLPFTAADGEASVALLNPLADTGASLRRRLLPTLARHAERNWNNHVRDVRLFEVGTVFERGAPGKRPVEQLRLGLVVTGSREPGHWTADAVADVDIWDLKDLAEVAGALAHPGATWHVEGDHFMARVKDGRTVGWAGRLTADTPPWGGALFGVEIDVTDGARAPVRVEALPTTPAVERDLSLVVPDGVASAAVVQVIQQAAGDLLEAVRITAEFRGAALREDRRSVTYRLTYRAPDRTLRDADVDASEAKVLSALERELKLSRRGA